MKSVKLIDTSILCEMLEIPGKSNATSARTIKAEFVKLVSNGVRFILPLAAIIETGNHIAQNGDGNVRRDKGETLKDFVIKSLAEDSPFLQPPLWDRGDLEAWIKDFPDSAMRGKGLGDVSIEHDLQIAKERLQLPSSLSIEIWSKDSHLA